MQSEPRLPDVLVKQLSRLHSRLVGITVAGGIGLTMLVLSLLLGGSLLLDLLVELPLVIRVVLLFSVPVVAGSLVVVSVVLPFLQRYRRSDLAVVVERAHPELRERLLSLVELQESVSRGDEPSSEFMRSRLMQQTVEFAEHHDFAESVDATRAVRRCWVGVAALCAVLLPLIFASQAYAVLISRFLNPWGNYERPQNLMLMIDRPDRVVGRGDDVAMTVHVAWRFHEGRFPDAVWLEWIGRSGGVQSRRLEWSEEEQTFSVLLPHMVESIDYQVMADQSRTKHHHIEVVDRPEIQQFAVNITPPAYTGEAAIHHENVLGEILAVEQSQLELQLAFNKPVARAELVWLDEVSPAADAARNPEDHQAKQPTTPLNLSADGQAAELTMPAPLSGPSGRFAVRVVDEYELTSRSENLFRLTIRPDLAPTVAFADQEQHSSARPQDFIQLPIQASDDFGVASLELHFDVLRNGNKESGKIALPAEQFPTRELSPLIPFDLASLNLESGMQVAFRVRATDERPVPAPNESWTGTRLLQILDEARPYGEQTLAESQHRANQAMDHLKADLEKQQQLARQLQAQAQTEDARHQDWSGQKKAAQLEENIQELAQQIQKLGAVLEDQPVMKPLADRAREISEKELAQAAARAEESQQVPLPQKQKKLAEAAEKLKKAEEEFKKIQEEHQEIAQKQRDLLELNRLAQNTEQLANQVDELARKRPPRSEQSAASTTPLEEMWNLEHQKLVQRHEQLENDLDQVLRDHPELIEKARANLAQRLEELGDRAQQLAQQQEELTRQKQNASSADKSSTDPSPSDPPADAKPPLQPSPETSSRKTDPQAASTQQPEQPGESSPQDQPDQMSQSLAKLPDEQQELASQTRELGEQLRRLELQNQELAKASSKLPSVTRAAAQELAGGNFKRAAELAREAAEKAQALSDSLKQPGQPIPERLQTAAEEASRQQQALSQRIENLADSSRQQAEFRTARQAELKSQTQEMERTLANQSEQLELKEIDRPKQAQTARQAQEQLQQASAGMEEQQALSPTAQKGDSQKGEQQAAESLRNAGKLVKEASQGTDPGEKEGHSAQGQAGQSVAESAQFLRQAGQQLKQLGQPQPARQSERDTSTQEKSSENGSGEGDGQSGSPQEKSQADSRESPTGKPDPSGEQSGSSQASELLRNAARNLREAAYQMGLSSRSEKSENPSHQPNGQNRNESTGRFASETAGNGEARLNELEKALGKVSRRNWGELPKNLQTELIESSHRSRDATYGNLIRKYFEEISRSRAPRLEDGAAGERGN